VLDGSPFGSGALARSGVIEADLRVLAPGMEVPLLPEGEVYAARVKAAGEVVVAHAYVRFLGDLNGGFVMRRRLAACVGDVAAGLRFPDHPEVEDRIGFIRDYRAELDRVVRQVGAEPVAAEALVAFEMNIALSEAVRTRAGLG
jgi:heme oxygenase